MSTNQATVFAGHLATEKDAVVLSAIEDAKWSYQQKLKKSAERLLELLDMQAPPIMVNREIGLLMASAGNYLTSNASSTSC